MLLVTLASLAFATDMSFVCLEVTRAADAEIYRDATGDAALTAWGLADGAMSCPITPTTCESPYTSCREAACTTADGVDATYSATTVEESGTGSYQSDAEAITLAATTGDWSAFTAGRVHDASSSGSSDIASSWSWSASWTGSISPDLPADATISYGTSSYESWSDWGEAAGWSDDTCSWSVTGIHAPEWTTWRVVVQDHTVQVEEGILGRCWVTYATVDDVQVGAVDTDTWERTPTDADGDAYTSDHTGSECRDCDDADPAIHPNAADAAGDGVDSDCDGVDGRDADGDGVASGLDCDDLDPSVYPDAPDSCDGVDQDCDGADEGCDSAGDPAGDDTAVDDSGGDSPTAETGDPDGPQPPPGCGCAAGGATPSAVTVLLALGVRRRRGRATDSGGKRPFCDPRGACNDGSRRVE